MTKIKLKHWFNICLVLFITLLFLLIFISIGNIDEDYCFKNPDKCVCEGICQKPNEDGSRCLEWVTLSKDIDWNNQFCKNEIIRKKTQAELDIDDCNNNPREDENCKCEEKQTTAYLNLTYYDVNVGNVTKEFNLKDICDSGIITDIEIHCKIPIYLTDKRITYLDSIIVAGEYNQFGKEICVKSRPKTECEKGNPDWVEKNICNPKDQIINDLDFNNCPDNIALHKICREK